MNLVIHPAKPLHNCNSISKAFFSVSFKELNPSKNNKNAFLLSYLKLTSLEVWIILRRRVSKVPSAMVGLRHGIVLSLNDFINVRDTESPASIIPWESKQLILIYCVILLKRFGQISLYVGSLDGQMPHQLKVPK